MSVPTHNLYDFIQHATKRNFCLLYFYPFGSKSTENILLADKIKKNKLITKKIYGNNINSDLLNNIYKNALQPILFCHDQEPLFFDHYNNIDIYRKINVDIDEDFYPYKDFNLRWAYANNLQKYWILLHSEKNSLNLKKYEETNRFIGAFYWSHAFLSLDWFRYAKYDLSLTYKYTNSKQFLTYCQGVTGTRKYRNNFKKLVTINNLDSVCQYKSFSGDDPNPKLSAEYNSNDISNTDFSVILETVFDERIHLTEKTCRALATGHPFLLAAGPGSLQLLKEYGFKTFAPWIDESYDEEPNSQLRLEKIVKIMKYYSSLPKSQRQKILKKCREIAQYNKKHFFSNTFFKICKNELVLNVNRAYNLISNDMFDIDRFFANLNWKISHCEKDIKEWKDPLRNNLDYKFFKHLQNNGTLEDYVPPGLD